MSTVRKIIDIPERASIVAGTGGLLLAIFYPPALIPSLLLVGGGYASLKFTDAVWPKKKEKR